MFDTEKFIECVENKPPLWNRHLKEYSDRTVRDECWLSIGQVMYRDWLQLDSQKKDEREKYKELGENTRKKYFDVWCLKSTCIGFQSTRTTYQQPPTTIRELKTKWRHVRDTFMKQINQSRNGTAPAKRKKYVYMDNLAFLHAVSEKSPKSGIVSVNTSEVDEMDDVEAADVIDYSEVTYDDVVEDLPARPSQEKSQALEDLPTEQSPERSRELKTTKKSLYKSHLLKKLGTSSKAEEDPDRMFMLSLLPDFKKLDGDEKLEFKLLSLQFFRSSRQRRVHPGAALAPLQPHPWVQVNFPMPGASHQYSTTQVPSIAPQMTPTPHPPTSSNKQS